MSCISRASRASRSGRCRRRSRRRWRRRADRAANRSGRARESSRKMRLRWLSDPMIVARSAPRLESYHATTPSTSRRTFLGQIATGLTAAVAGPDDPGTLPTRPARSARRRHRRVHLRGHPRLGRTAGGSQVRQHAWRVRGPPGQHLRPPHGARDQRAARHDGRLRSQRQVRPQLGQRVRGWRARPAHPPRRAATSSSISATRSVRSSRRRRRAARWSGSSATRRNRRSTQ